MRHTGNGQTKFTEGILVSHLCPEHLQWCTEMVSSSDGGLMTFSCAIACVNVFEQHTSFDILCVTTWPSASEIANKRSNWYLVSFCEGHTKDCSNPYLVLIDTYFPLQRKNGDKFADKLLHSYLVIARVKALRQTKKVHSCQNIVMHQRVPSIPGLDQLD